MDYKHAPGRNWAREKKRGPSAHLRRESGADARPTPSSQWYTLGDLKHAAGRNWTHEPPRKPLGLGRASAPAEAPSPPSRERGGGDHDQPYAYQAPSSCWTFPFSTREYARLLVLKSHLAEARRRLARYSPVRPDLAEPGQSTP